jgi:Ni,Fe-hydrogenase I large subunit
MQAEAAAAAGESSFRAFMVAVQRSTTNVAMVQQVFDKCLSCLVMVFCRQIHITPNNSFTCLTFDV